MAKKKTTLPMVLTHPELGKLVRAKDAAELVGVKPQSIATAILTGKIRAEKQARSVFVTLDSLTQYAKAGGHSLTRIRQLE